MSVWALPFAFIGVVPIVRFLIFYLQGGGDGHVQSLVIGGALLVLGTIVAVMGVLADLIAANRKLIEMSLVRLRQIEERLPAPVEKQEPVAASRRKGAA